MGLQLTLSQAFQAITVHHHTSSYIQVPLRSRPWLSLVSPTPIIRSCRKWLQGVIVQATLIQYLGRFWVVGHGPNNFGVSTHGGTQNGWFIMEHWNISLKWMMTAGIPLPFFRKPPHGKPLETGDAKCDVCRCIELAAWMVLSLGRQVL